MKVLSESYSINTNMTGFRWFSENLCVLDGLRCLPYNRGRLLSDAGRSLVDTGHTCPCDDHHRNLGDRKLQETEGIATHKI